MVDYYDDSYVEDREDEIFCKWFEVDGVNTIKELSRQLRTFLRYKEEVIKNRYRSSLSQSLNRDISLFLNQKQKLYIFSSNYINSLKKVKEKAQSIEQGIQYFAMRIKNTPLHQLIEITHKLLVLIHQFSEENLHDHPDLLQFIVKLAREVCVVKKCLDIPLSEFYAELELNYGSLEIELEELLLDKDSHKNVMRKQELKKQVPL